MTCSCTVCNAIRRRYPASVDGRRMAETPKSVSVRTQMLSAAMEARDRCDTDQDPLIRLSNVRIALDAAIAAGTQSAETSETSAPSEGCQSGPKGIAPNTPPNHPRST
jgi:hypothetical protein